MNIKDYIVNITKPLSRFLARILDYSLFYTLLILPLFFVSLFNSIFIHLMAITLLPLLWIPIEALLISLFGTTPGKALFGIQIRDAKARKLSLRDSLKRAFWTVFKGMGINIPLINLAYAFFSFKQIQKTGRSKVDQDLSTYVYHKKRRTLRTILGSILVALCSLFFVTEYELRDVITSSDQSFFSNNLTKSVERANWKNYQDPEGAYSIQFPGSPQTESKQLAIPGSKDKLPFHALQYRTDKAGVEYSLNYTTLPRDWLKYRSALLLKGSLKIINSHFSKGKILKKSANNYGNFPSLEFIIAQKDNRQCSGRLVLVDNVLYKLEMTYPLEMEADVQADLNDFLDSFKPK